ncbi:ABC transporter substrate-binding protein [Streptomyces boluensis]|uniref:Extracellular solute-binding protein n=1 Tax=Streptomyces boluensis TaxID=1775135 RepID=A0A964UJY4_9ACTN|nr:extracellular solute-binding protein [Streptomyces boluensis]NBE50564.1 extracellular solute-binding protein [Streptomyces boluensis]
MHIRKAPLCAAVAATALLAAAGCSAGPDTAPAPTSAGGADKVGGSSSEKQLGALYQAAQDKHESQILVYGPSQNFYATAYAAFQKRYPAIKIVPQPVFGQQLITKLAQEFSSGKHAGSVQTNGGSGIAASDQAEQCESYKPFTATGKAADEAGAGSPYSAFARFAVGIEYNTDKIKADKAPKSWKELADPKWRGKLVQADPGIVGVTSLMISNLLAEKKLDEGWIKGLSANKPQTVDTAALAEQSLARGERQVMVANNSAVFTAAKDKKLPVGFVFPTSEGARFDTQYVCLLKGAPAPNASKLLVNWLHTEEGQTALSKAGVYGTRSGTPAPEGLPVMADIQSKAIPEIPAAQQSAELGMTLDIVKNVQK